MKHKKYRLLIAPKVIALDRKVDAIYENMV